MFPEDQGLYPSSKRSPELEEKRDVTLQPYLGSYVISIAFFQNILHTSPLFLFLFSFLRNGNETMEVSPLDR